MSVELDHAIVPSRDRRAAAELLATLLGVPWAATGVGPFCPVYVNEGLTLDFDQADGPFAVQHYCFRVSEAEFDGIVTRIRARGIDYRSTPHGPVDMQINTQHGGRIVYWNEPDGHVWEALTVSYARQPPKGTQGDAEIPDTPGPVFPALTARSPEAPVAALGRTGTISDQTVPGHNRSLMMFPRALTRVCSLAIEVAGNIRLGRVIEVLTRLISLGCSGSQARQAPGGSLIRAEKPMERQSG